MQALTAGPLVAVSSLREFFRDAFHTASQHQHLDIDEQAEQYVVNLLTMFSRADALYERTPDGLRIKPLAHMLADALEAPSASARQRGLQRLGDVSLSDMSYRYSDADILRLYEIWMKTGSPRARGLLRQLGVQPVTAAGARREH